MGLRFFARLRSCSERPMGSIARWFLNFQDKESGKTDVVSVKYKDTNKHAVSNNHLSLRAKMF